MHEFVRHVNLGEFRVFNRHRGQQQVAAFKGRGVGIGHVGNRNRGARWTEPRVHKLGCWLDRSGVFRGSHLMAWKTEQANQRRGRLIYIEAVSRHHERRSCGAQRLPRTFSTNQLRTAYFLNDPRVTPGADERRRLFSALARHADLCVKLTLRFPLLPPVHHLKHAVAFGKVR